VAKNFLEVVPAWWFPFNNCSELRELYWQWRLSTAISGDRDAAGQRVGSLL